MREIKWLSFRTLTTLQTMLPLTFLPCVLKDIPDEVLKTVNNEGQAEINKVYDLKKKLIYFLSTCLAAIRYHHKEKPHHKTRTGSGLGVVEFNSISLSELLAAHTHCEVFLGAQYTYEAKKTFNRTFTLGPDYDVFCFWGFIGPHSRGISGFRFTGTLS